MAAFRKIRVSLDAFRSACVHSAARGGRSVVGGLLVGTLILAGALLSDVVIGAAAAESGHRYPYDPVCAWGRVADGGGMLVRCLVKAEAEQLMGQSAAKPVKQSNGKPAADVAAEKKPTVIDAKLGPIAVDTGTLPEAVPKLNTANKRFVQCVQDNGGLSQRPAKLELRFLVRERGRAEGVSVQKRTGLSESAGRCIADVVDRRYVGYPAAPIVGATLTIEFSEK